MLQNLTIFRKFTLSIAARQLIGLGLAAYSAVQWTRSITTTRISSPSTTPRRQADKGRAKCQRRRLFGLQGACLRRAECRSPFGAANFDDKMQATRQLLDEIGTSLPVYAPALAEMASGATEIVTKGKAANALGLQDRNDESRAVLADMDVTVADFVKRYQTLRDQMLSDTAALSASALRPDLVDHLRDDGAVAGRPADRHDRRRPDGLEEHHASPAAPSRPDETSGRRIWRSRLLVSSGRRSGRDGSHRRGLQAGGAREGAPFHQADAARRGQPRAPSASRLSTTPKPRTFAPSSASSRRASRACRRAT